MRIQTLSDFHSEFFPDLGKEFIYSLNPNDINVLVLAGDIAVGKDIPVVLKYFCDHFKKSQVLYCKGNHEYYGSDLTTNLKYIHQTVEQNPNLRWLENSIVEIPYKDKNGLYQTQRFLGSTLWYPKNNLVLEKMKYWSDFIHIKDLNKWIFNHNKRAIDFFARETREGDICISHYLPSWKCVADIWKESDCNCFFVCDIENVILTKKPKYWIFGHTHTSVDVKIGETRAFNNPFGYFGYDLNLEFKKDFILEIL